MYQGAYETSYKGAMELLLCDRVDSVTVNRHSGEIVDFRKGYAVGGASRILTELSMLPRRNAVHATIQLGRWIDALERNVDYIRGWWEGDRFHWDAVTFYENLWEAEADALARGNARVYNYASGECFRPNE